MIYPVGYDGQISPVEAKSKEEARNIIKMYFQKIGMKINLITIYDSSDGYNEWVKTWDIKTIQ